MERRELKFSQAYRVGSALVVLAVLILAARRFGAAIPDLLREVRAFGDWAPVAYIGLFVVAVILMVPAWLLTVVGGALFGLWPGIPIALIAATSGALAAFVLARLAGRAALATRFARSPRFEALDRAVAANGLKIVFLLRMSPVVPYNVLNYALGLTRVRFRDVLLGSIGMLPATSVYVYCGMLAGDAVALSGAAAPPRGPGYFAVLAAGLAATVAATVVVTRVARRALRSAVPPSSL